MLTAEQIQEARSQTVYSRPDDGPSDCDDCVRIAHEWLDAQRRIKSPNTRKWSLSHLITDWSGMHVSKPDVEVAAQLHGLIGQYPHYNIETRWVEPSLRRLDGITSANSQPNYRKNHKRSDYSSSEP